MISAGVKYAQNYKNLSGTEKKDIVIRALRDVINDRDGLSDDDKKMLIDYIDTFADDTIDYLVDFGRHMYLKVKKSCC